jgi:hypothetical protein
MQKVLIFGALAALFLLFTPASQGQTADEVKSLRRENELLKREIELLKKELELLKRETELLRKEAKAGADSSKTGAGSNSGAKAMTKASLAKIDYELVKCVRDRKNPKKVTFTISAQCDTGNPVVPFTAGGGGGFGPPMVPSLSLTARGGDPLTGGKTKDIAPTLQLARGVPALFKISYDGVDKDITQLDTVRLTAPNRLNAITFYNIKIEPK